MTFAAATDDFLAGWRCCRMRRCARSISIGREATIGRRATATISASVSMGMTTSSSSRRMPSRRTCEIFAWRPTRRTPRTRSDGTRTRWASRCSACATRRPPISVPTPYETIFSGYSVRTVASLCARYALPIDAEHLLTHAEAAIVDGYFGDGDESRWDLARLRPSSLALDADEARATGEHLRARIASP